jgi:protein arginine N-methyltransferase 1
MLDPLEEHYGYLSDRVKLARYQAAIEHVVKPGRIVMDLGCGSGLLGLMALRAGAEKVLFVEEGAVLEIARRSVLEAGFGERAQFLKVNSYELELPDRVDVILCDHVGYFGFDYGILALLGDAKRRFLKEAGVIVPAEVELKLAAVETEEGRALAGRWRDGSVPADFAWVGTSAANTKQAVNLAADNLLTKPASLATLELGETAGDFLQWSAELASVRDGTLDGLLGWFDCRLHGDIHMSNSPIADNPLNRPQAFLPLEEPVTVCEGDEIQATVMARPADHILAWTLDVYGRQHAQTTFNGLLLDDQALSKGRPDRIAGLNDRGRARQTILSYCDGQRTVAEVEALVREKHPDLFPSAQATEKFVRKVLASDTAE